MNGSMRFGLWLFIVGILAMLVAIVVQIYLTALLVPISGWLTYFFWSSLAGTAIGIVIGLWSVLTKTSEAKFKPTPYPRKNYNA